MSDLTLKIDDKQIQFMRLILRSPDRGEGWRSVSDTLRNFVTGMIEAQSELYETRLDGETLMVRLSERGAILAAYM